MIPVFSYVYALISGDYVPAGAPPQLRAACRALAPASAILWGVGLSDAWGAARAIAVAATAGFFTCWANAVRHDAERRALLHAIAELSGRREPPTGPLRAVS